MQTKTKIKLSFCSQSTDKHKLKVKGVCISYLCFSTKSMLFSFKKNIVRALKMY